MAGLSVAALPMTSYAADPVDITVSAEIGEVPLDIVGPGGAGTQNIDFGTLSVGLNQTTSSNNSAIMILGNTSGSYTLRVGAPNELGTCMRLLPSANCGAAADSIPTGVPVSGGSLAWGYKINGAGVTQSAFSAVPLLASDDTGGDTITSSGTISATGDTYTIDSAINMPDLSLTAGQYQGTLRFIATKN